MEDVHRSAVLQLRARFPVIAMPVAMIRHWVRRLTGCTRLQPVICRWAEKSATFSSGLIIAEGHTTGCRINYREFRMKSSCWVLTEIRGERQYGGNEGYTDLPALTYAYDSHVAKHKNLKPGDVVIFRDRDAATGASVISSIQERNGTKELNRCPRCRKTGITEENSKTGLALFRMSS